jgi:hypothetical protein
MTAAAISRIVGGALVLIVGAAVALGGVHLWRGGPEKWPDTIADETTTRRIAVGMIVVAVLTLISGGAAIGNISWGGYAAAISTLVVVAAAFWVHHTLFGDIRPLKTGTNVVVGAIILALLWIGYAKQPSDAPGPDASEGADR